MLLDYEPPELGKHYWLKEKALTYGTEERSDRGA